MIYNIARGWDRDYRGNPPAEPGIKPVFMDMDHIAAVDQDGDNDWNNSATTPWKLLTRGYHQCMYDHDYWKPGHNRAGWEMTRRNIGMTAEFAKRMALADMHPRADLASTTYCLANPGHEYLVFSPSPDEITMRGLLAGRTYRVEWSFTSTRQVVPRETYRATSDVGRFLPPRANAILYLALDEQNAVPERIRLRDAVEPGDTVHGLESGPIGRFEITTSSR